MEVYMLLDQEDIKAALKMYAISKGFDPKEVEIIFRAAGGGYTSSSNSRSSFSASGSSFSAKIKVEIQKTGPKDGPYR